MPTATAPSPASPSAHTAVEEELLWFFNSAPGEMGLRSSYLAMIRRLLAPGERGPAATGYELDERALVELEHQVDQRRRGAADIGGAQLVGLTFRGTWRPIAPRTAQVELRAAVLRQVLPAAKPAAE